MCRFFHRSSIFCRSVALSMCWLFSCSAYAQDVNCNQIAGIFAISEWRNLATGPFIERKRNFISGSVGTRAPAKSLIAGFENCTIWLNQYLQHQYWNEVFNYKCKAPASTAKGNDHMGAAKAVAAQWQSCFVGWSESSDSNKLDFGAMARVLFSNKDYIVSFTRDNIGPKTEPVEITITKLVRK